MRKREIIKKAIAFAKVNLYGLAYGLGIYVVYYITESLKMGDLITFYFEELILSLLFGWFISVIIFTIIIVVIIVVGKIYLKIR